MRFFLLSNIYNDKVISYLISLLFIKFSVKNPQVANRKLTFMTDRKFQRLGSHYIIVVGFRSCTHGLMFIEDEQLNNVDIPSFCSQPALPVKSLLLLFYEWLIAVCNATNVGNLSKCIRRLVKRRMSKGAGTPWGILG